MLKQNFWRLLFTIAVIAWSFAELIPLKNRPFDQYIQSQVEASPKEFAGLMKDAKQQVAERKTSSLYGALKNLSDERKIDLSKFFPQLRLESSLKNIDQRNEILLDALLKRSKGKLQLGLDLKGGVAFMLQVPAKSLANVPETQRKQKLTKAVEIISARINSLGVSEPVVRPVGDNRIEVEIPAVTTKDNPDIASSLKKPARLDFRLVYPEGTPETIPESQAPPGYQAMSMDQTDQKGNSYSIQLYVKRIPSMTGDALKEAYPSMDEFGRFKVLLKFTKKGGEEFARVTRQIAEEGRKVGHLCELAIVLDGKLYSAPTVKEEIDGGSAEITGSFTQREAVDLANVLNNPLDLPLEIKEENEIGPTLARDSIESGVHASEVGAFLVAGFMILYYTWAGAIAVFSVSVNILGVLAVLASLGATITMPGIAGIVLTIGMAVDAHILIFERMREELALGKSLSAALHAGHEKAFTTIVDANLTTLIAGVLMIAFGTGPVKGFGITLSIGIFSTMFTALIVSQMLLEMAVGWGWLKRIVMLNFMRPPDIDFLRFGKRAFLASWTLVLIGVVAVFVRGRAIYGIDFVGGDNVTMSFTHHVPVNQLRAALEKGGVRDTVPLYQSDISGGNPLLNVQTHTGRGKEAAHILEKAFPSAHLSEVGISSIGPSIGAEIQRNAFLALGLSILGIMLYVAFRFEVGYGVGAVLATVHDVLMTIGMFVLTGRQFDAPMVAAILLIVGYSVNDTIVVFDRIREELKVSPTGTLREIINRGINRVFARSILTSFTTFLAALALYVFAGGAINDLSFTFLVGIATGTFSSIFVASPIFFWWHKGDRKHVEAHHDIAPKYEWTGTSRAAR